VRANGKTYMIMGAAMTRQLTEARLTEWKVYNFLTEFSSFGTLFSATLHVQTLGFNVPR
jgi:hypothetical protein